MTIHSEGINTHGNEKLINAAEAMTADEIHQHPMAALDKLRALARELRAVEKAHTPTDDDRGDLIGAASAAFKARGGAPDWEEDAIARDLILRWHLRGFEDGEKFGRRSEVPEPSAEPKHDDSCSEWCNHCAVCGVGTRYGSRCPGHYQNQPQSEPSDAAMSNVSINGVRQTWQQMYEQEHEAHVALQGYRTMLADLDRNASGRHQGDYDSYATGNGGISAGNPHLTTGQTVGYDIGGRAYVVPEPRDRGTLSAWLPAVTEQGENR